MTTPVVPAPVTGPAVVVPGSLGIPSVAPLYADGIPVALATPAATTVPSPDAATASQRFWSSEPRSAADGTKDVLRVDLSKPKPINYITLDLPHFPHRVKAYWLQPDGTWELVNGPNGAPLWWMISGSVPAIVDSAAALSAGLNPYHYGAGHWLHYDEMIEPITTSSLMFAADRLYGDFTGAPEGPWPVNAAGKQVPYPVGIRGLDFGYRAVQRSDAPWTPRSSTVATEREPFTTSVDLHGSPVQLSVRENRASDMLLGLPWKCAPQPTSSAVVCLYADARDASGAQQVIDRFYISPVTTGVRLNLYYAPEGPVRGAGFQAQDSPIVFPLVTVDGSAQPVYDGSGLLFADQPGWLDFSNQGVDITGTSPWWLGIAIMPQFAATDQHSYMIMDAGVFQLYYDNGIWTVSAGGGILASWNLAFSLNDVLAFAVGFDGQQLFAWAPQGGFGAAASSTGLPGAGQIRFGSVQNEIEETSWTGNYRLLDFILKQEQLDFSAGIPGDLTGFASAPAAYTAPLNGPGETTMNALARFDSSFVLGLPGSGINPYGFVGGPGSSYESCSWIPVQRDYTLAEGYLQFDPVLAAVFKFEFTSLQAQTYEFYAESPQTAKVFPVISPPVSSVPQQNSDAVLDAGLETNQSLAPTVSYADAPAPQNAPAAGSALPTEALYATDPAAASAMASSGGSLYNFQQWQSQPNISSNVISGPAAYQEISIKQKQRVAYFVSLSSLQMYRCDYTSAVDTDEYVDTFGDTANISPASLENTGGTALPWAWQAGSLTAPPSLAGQEYAQVSSVTFNSASPVRGIQFATAQSDPVQLFADPDFSLDGMPDWGPVGDATISTATNINAQLGLMAQVARNPAENSWNTLTNLFSSWDSIESSNSDWTDLQGVQTISSYGGIAYTGIPVTTTAAGRVYAAARVFSQVALSAPLALQILDGATGAVLAEEDQVVAGGTVTEWYAGYTIGEGSAPVGNTWAEVMGSNPEWADTEGQSWIGISNYYPPLGAQLTAQLIQQGITSDTWYTDNISLFEDSIVWEFSNDNGASWWPAYDIRNNPYGVLTFPAPQQGDGNQLLWQVSGYRPGLHVSSLAIRPWYQTITAALGVPPRAAGVGHGPNLSPHDHYTYIEQDPRWQAWDQPIPQDWYFAYRQLLQLENVYVPVAAPAALLPTQLIVLGSALAIPPPIPIVPPGVTDTFTDVYSDNYPAAYGVVDGSDIYTDNFGNDYYTNYLTDTDSS
jgi:hypothetical protein